MNVARPLSEYHQSDGDCLAMVKFRHDTPQPSGAPAVIGTLAHEVIEQYTYEQAEHPDVKPAAVMREVLASRLGDPEVTPAVVDATVAILAGAFASDLRLGLPGEGWECVPEWRWALDSEFRPIAQAGDGWASAPAYAGTVDRLEFHQAKGKVIVFDWKTIIVKESAEDIRTKKQARIYALAILAHFPKVNMVEFREVNLRHCYFARAEFKRGDPWEEQTRARMRTARAARLQAIEKDAWPETPGTDCRYCPRLFACGQEAKAREWGDEPSGTPAEVAGLYLFTKALHARLTEYVKGVVEATQAPIALPNGDALGLKPVRGLLMDRTYERAMAELRMLGMSAEQEVEWFRYVTESGLASRVKKALETLCGYQAARRFIDNGGWIDEVTEFEFSVWTPDATVAPEEPRGYSIEDLDALLEERL